MNEYEVDMFGRSILPRQLDTPLRSVPEPPTPRPVVDGHTIIRETLRAAGAAPIIRDTCSCGFVSESSQERVTSSLTERHLYQPDVPERIRRSFLAPEA